MPLKKIEQNVGQSLWGVGNLMPIALGFGFSNVEIGFKPSSYWLLYTLLYQCDTFLTGFCYYSRLRTHTVYYLCLSIFAEFDLIKFFIIFTLQKRASAVATLEKSPLWEYNCRIFSLWLLHACCQAVHSGIFLHCLFCLVSRLGIDAYTILQVCGK